MNAREALEQKCRNGTVSTVAFRTLTQPGQPDPKLRALGWNLRQSVDGQETYSLTVVVNGHPITPLTFVKIGQMMRVSRNGTAEVVEFSYEAVARLNEQIREQYPEAEWPQPPPVEVNE